jgi:hypothetical protein
MVLVTVMTAPVSMAMVLGTASVMVKSVMVTRGLVSSVLVFLGMELAQVSSVSVLVQE